MKNSFAPMFNAYYILTVANICVLVSALLNEVMMTGVSNFSALIVAIVLHQSALGIVIMIHHKMTMV